MENHKTSCFCYFQNGTGKSGYVNPVLADITFFYLINSFFPPIMRSWHFKEENPEINTAPVDGVNSNRTRLGQMSY